MKFGVYSSYIPVVPRIYIVAFMNPRYNTTVKKILSNATSGGDCCISRRRKLGAYMKYLSIRKTLETTEYKESQYPNTSLRSKLKEGQSECRNLNKIGEKQTTPNSVINLPSNYLNKIMKMSLI